MHDNQRRNMRSSLELLANLLYIAKRENDRLRQAAAYLDQAEVELNYLIGTLKQVS
jgi:hypothetical protein